MARGRHGKKIDYTHWTLWGNSALALSAGSVASSLFAAQHEPETLLRMRGEVMVYADGNQAPGGLATIGVGFILVPEGTGTTVLWSPFTDGDAPWIWTGYYAIGYEEPVIDVVDIPSLSGVRDVIDSKAMRIVRNQEIQMVTENVSVGSAMNINLTSSGRALFGH